MQPYQAQFIEFLVQAGVLTFGDFVTKSGRKTPYFVNTGNYRLGSQLDRLGEFYAQTLLTHLGDGFDNLYGPAYKGIPLAVAAGIALNRGHGRDVSVTYNRKEAKDHGEKGLLIGHQYQGAERVVIIEDVITAGTSIRESLAILAAQGQPRVVGVIVSVDRMERGQGRLSAVQEVRQEFGIPVFAIVTVRDIIAHLHNRPLDGRTLIDNAGKARMEAYLAEYGVTG
jgi:orotate phosphoribosyltransferase